MAKDKTETKNPLEKGREYKALFDTGISVPDIAQMKDVSVPAVYKYMQLAGCNKHIQNHIDKGNITASKVIELLHKHEGKELMAEVKKAVAAERTKKLKMKREGITKMTVKRRLTELVKTINNKDETTEKEDLLMGFAQLINQGASVEEVLALAKG